MGDKRQKLKRHIRAAKEWLGQAENSLDKEDELSSELKIMLAKAELKRAAEADGARSRRRKILMRMKNFAKIIAAPVAALILAAAAGFIPGGEEKETAVDATEIADAPSAVENAANPLASDIVPKEQPPVATAEVAAAEESAAESEVAAATPPAYVAPQREYSPPKIVPDEDTQQLMQSAYFSLRKS